MKTFLILLIAMLFVIPLCIQNQYIAHAGVNVWTSHSPLGSGGRGLALDPQTPSTIYVGGGGVYKSTDGGGSWVTSLVNTRGIYAIAVDPINPQIVYAGGPSPVLQSRGVLMKSTDGGGAWSTISNELFSAQVWTIAVNPSLPTTIYAGLVAGVPGDSSILKSTDGGSTWTVSLDSIVQVMSLGIDPSSPNIIYAGLQRYFPQQSGPIRSTDGGSTWTDVDIGVPNGVVKAIAIHSQTVYLGLEFGGVVKSTDGGSTWASKNNGFDLATTRVRAIAIDPSSPNTVYSGLPSPYNVYKTTNGGDSWAAFNNGLGLGADGEAIVVDPSGIHLHTSTGLRGEFDYTYGSTTCTLTCPTNVMEAAGAGQCGTNVDYATPTTTGDCGTVMCAPTSGSFFPVGNTTVTCTAATGPSCSFTITVQDTQPPMINCPANASATALVGQTCAVVNYPAPTAIDNCGTPSVQCFPISGFCFPIGVTTVTCTARDASNNSQNCNFTVSVAGTCVPPSITTQPVSQTISSGQAATLIIAATGTSPLTYQWYRGITGDVTVPVGSNSNIFTTPILTSTTSYWVQVRNNCGSVNSNTATITVNSIEGDIGIWDGSELWPFDGIGISQLRVVANQRGGGGSGSFSVPQGSAHYRFENLPQGDYDLTVILDYREQITSNLQFCIDPIQDQSPGCSGVDTFKRTRLTLGPISVPQVSPFPIKFAPPLVMVHGVHGCFLKWVSPQGNLNFWDNYVRSQGFISFTPNYDWLMDESHPWELMAGQVKTQVELDFRLLTRRANSSAFPPWFFIGHSQGGLIARVLTSGDSFQTPLVNSLQKIFLLGTPNDGGILDAGAFLICTPYLGPDPMQADFNLNYPFYTKKVLAYAGTKPAGKTKILPTNDSIVYLTSVHQIHCSVCSPTLLQLIDGKNFFFNHHELGSPESRDAILIGEILPEICRQAGTCSR